MGNASAVGAIDMDDVDENESVQLSFEGLEVHGCRYSLSAVNGTTAPLRYGDRVTITVEAEVERIQHGGNPFQRLHVLKAIEAKISS